MTARPRTQHLTGHRLLDENGDSVGRIGQVYFDDETDTPVWAAVRTGPLGRHESLVPIGVARMAGEDVQVPFDRETITTAPEFGADRHISAEQEHLVYRHYGIRPAVPGQRPDERDTLDPAPDGDPDEVPEGYMIPEDARVDVAQGAEEVDVGEDGILIYEEYTVAGTHEGEFQGDTLVDMEDDEPRGGASGTEGLHGEERERATGKPGPRTDRGWDDLGPGDLDRGDPRRGDVPPPPS
ncbi:PRC-barrel domain-containing protein [Marinactinospora thermotolerans]|uniref:PRC-barrel domain-containing protein n=1 Tax=Marinactinospora thermotolerans DSM 45154 TaxID=1122192 RepID=A0A1T4ST66_9ACTN|nr:PRC-barrel domain-containing protein [Marinactinospora thermotolerans]SKA31356.1 PRC-barrel domain-containing protein [Marinactinospora thermotolerans DSM 45154]